MTHAKLQQARLDDAGIAAAACAGVNSGGNLDERERKDSRLRGNDREIAGGADANFMLSTAGISCNQRPQGDVFPTKYTIY